MLFVWCVRRCGVCGCGFVVVVVGWLCCYSCLRDSPQRGVLGTFLQLLYVGPPSFFLCVRFDVFGTPSKNAGVRPQSEVTLCACRVTTKTRLEVISLILLCSWLVVAGASFLLFRVSLV